MVYSQRNPTPEKGPSVRGGADRTCACGEAAHHLFMSTYRRLGGSALA
jgi:hypothetical protein